MTFEEELNKAKYTLLQDVATIKDAFIVDELQSYMNLSDPSNPFWITPVRLRLQEKRDWEQRVKEVMLKIQDLWISENGRNSPNYYGEKVINEALKELGLEK